VRRAVLVLCLLLAGCSFGGDDGGSVQPGELASLVLQPDDLPREFQRFDEGRQAIADNPGGSRADTERFGRQGGWKARYRRVGTGRAAGPLVIESRADLFDSPGGADEDLGAARADLDEANLDWQPIDEPGLGDESFAATLVQSGGTQGVRYYQVFWRQSNVTASLNVSGFEGRVALSDALELARKQDRRISEASGG
jgi:hypothetical protein